MAHDEIERRWLVTKMNISILKLKSLASNTIEISQGYLGVPRPDNSFRIRIKNNKAAEVSIKKGRGIKRRETSPKDSGVSLNLGKEIAKIAHHRLLKTRYEVGVWEIDVCHEPLEGVVLIEIEKKENMTSIDGDIKLPDFVEEVVEVTDTLTSSRLARLATELNGLNLPAMPFVMELLRPIPRIGIVGDPGSGKTGIINILRKEFPEIHFVPEVAKILIDDVGIPTTKDSVQNRRFQKAVYDVNKTFEKLAISHAVTHEKKGLLFDRPNPDGVGYFDGGIEEFETFLDTSIKAELRKIDMAIYLEIPSKKIYEKYKKNSSYRTESYEEAKTRGARTRAVWWQHHNVHVISNKGGWDEKVEKVRKLIKSVIKI